MITRCGVLFVCLGNICRSPLAEAMFVARARRSGVIDRFDVESCGTGHWHVGEPADPRAIAAGAKRGIEVVHTARQLDPRRDGARFAWFIAMDRSNARNVVAAGVPAASVRLLRSFDPALAREPESGLDVPDPYYGEDAGFDEVARMIDDACAGLLALLLDQE